MCEVRNIVSSGRLCRKSNEIEISMSRNREILDQTKGNMFSVKLCTNFHT